MSREQFEPLPDSAFVFRLATIGSVFLPQGACLPTGDFFRPSSGDIKEGEELGRAAGLSVWDNELTQLSDAKRIRREFHPMENPDLILAFGIRVSRIRALGRASEASVEVVAFPYGVEYGLGAEGHSHVEGLERPKGESKKKYYALRERIASECAAVE